MAEFQKVVSNRKTNTDKRLVELEEQRRRWATESKINQSEQVAICPHTPTKNLPDILLRGYNDVQGKTKKEIEMVDWFTKDAVVVKCSGRNGCGCMFQLSEISAEDLDKSLFVINSMIQQLKMASHAGLVSMSDQAVDDIMSMAGAIPALELIVETYIRFRKDVNTKGKNPNYKNKSTRFTKGGVSGNLGSTDSRSLYR